MRYLRVRCAMPEPAQVNVATGPIARPLRVTSADGATTDLYLIDPAGSVLDVVLWLPALGVAARNYLAFADALAEHGIAVALHEWRGIGSSDRRARRASDWGYRELLTLDIPASVAAVRTAWPGARVWLGGHSLGGQLSALYASLHSGDHAGLLLIASGAPYWRRFSRPWLIGFFAACVPAIAAACGYFPGRRLRFAGNEARGVMTDWARTARSGRYAVDGIDQDIDAALRVLTLPIFALRLQKDWLAPLPSLQWLLDKMPLAPRRIELIGPNDLDHVSADHFGWMKSPSLLAGSFAAYLNGNTQS
ncbi:MAG: alpha/beta fold hydrolase [Dokdonella sp.]